MGGLAKLATSAAAASIAPTLILGGCDGARETAATAAGAAVADTPVTAGGSSFAAPIVKHWFEVYAADQADAALSYESVGSEAGIDRFLAGSVDIGATDAPLGAAETAQGQARFVQLPVTGGMIAIAYNLPGLDAPLNLPRQVYPAIFLGEIDRWDDARPGRAGPARPVGGGTHPRRLRSYARRLRRVRPEKGKSRCGRWTRRSASAPTSGDQASARHVGTA